MTEQGMTEQEMAEHNAVAWLRLTDDELIERSASLGLPGDLHPEAARMEEATEATADDVAQARQTADDFAREHAGAKFVNRWIKENRPPISTRNRR